MSDALDISLNDHLAGAVLGCGLAEQLGAQNEGAPLGELMATLTVEIESDRQTLADLMKRMGTVTNPVKQGTAWLAEKVSHVTFTGTSSGNPDLGTFLALEALSLGVEGKISLWRSLKAIGADNPVMAGMDFDLLISRGMTQRGALESQRMASGVRALQGGDGSTHPAVLAGDRPSAQGDSVSAERPASCPGYTALTRLGETSHFSSLSGALVGSLKMQERRTEAQ